MITPPAASSISESMPNAISATEDAAMPAPTAIANSTKCHALPIHANLRARPSSSDRSATAVATTKGYRRSGLLRGPPASVREAIRRDLLPNEGVDDADRGANKDD